MRPDKGMIPLKPQPEKVRHYNTGPVTPGCSSAQPAEGTAAHPGDLSRHLKIRKLRVSRTPGRRLLRCAVTVITLETGETVKKGCGRRGLAPFEAGLKCFYCGNVQYKAGSSLDELWFHFRLGREYWRVQSSGGREYVNGVPVRGAGDGLPPECMRDLADPRPPEWFRLYVQGDENQFQQYLRNREAH